MKNYPHVCDGQFVEKFKNYMETVLKPVLKIKDFWVSFEWQKRGSIHSHCLFWLDDQPDILKAFKLFNSDDKVKKSQGYLIIIDALEYYAKIVNAEHPLIGDTNRIDMTFEQGAVPILHTTPKQPRSYKSQYKPPIHASEKVIPDKFENIDEMKRD